MRKKIYIITVISSLIILIVGFYMAFSFHFDNNMVYEDYPYYCYSENQFYLCGQVTDVNDGKTSVNVLGYYYNRKIDDYAVRKSHNANERMTVRINKYYKNYLPKIRRKIKFNSLFDIKIETIDTMNYKEYFDYTMLLSLKDKTILNYYDKSIKIDDQVFFDISNGGLYNTYAYGEYSPLKHTEKLSDNYRLFDVNS